jgi:hypothetical protein
VLPHPYGWGNGKCYDSRSEITKFLDGYKEGSAFIVEFAAIVFLVITARFWLPIVAALGAIGVVLAAALVLLVLVFGR